MLDAAAAVTPPGPETPSSGESPPSTEGGAPNGEVRKTLSTSERRARARSLLMGDSGESQPAPDAPSEDPPAQVESAESTEPAKKRGAKAQDGEAEQTEQRPGESDAKYQARLARAMADLRKRDQALLEKDKGLKEIEGAKTQLENDLAEMRKRMEAISKDPFEALKAAGTSYEELSRKYLRGEIKPPDEADTHRAEADERSSALEAKLAELEAKLAAEEQSKQDREAQAKQAEARSRDLATTSKILEASADSFPLLSALPNGAEKLLDACYANEVNDPIVMAEKFEEVLANEVTPFLQNERALATLIKSQPKLRETLRALLGPEQRRQDPKAEGPRALASDLVSASTTANADKPRTARERKNAALRKLRGE